MSSPIEIVVTSTDKTKGGFDSAERDAQRFAQGVQQAGTKADKALRQVDTTADTVGRQMQAAGRQADRALVDVGQTAEKTGRQIKEAGEEGEHFGQQFGHSVGEEATGVAEKFSDELGPIGSILGKLGPLGLAAGAAIGVGLLGAKKVVEQLHKALDASIERSKAAALVGAQTGATDPAAIRTLARTAGKIWADNFGDSIDQVGATLTSVTQNLRGWTDDSADSIKNLAEQVLTLGKVSGEDASRISGTVAQLLRTGLAKNATEAFDILTRGFQEGANKAGDLLDTLNEYPTQFRKLGIDAQTATGLLVQGMQAGARDSDIVADALKEFSIRAVDGSKLTAQGFKMLGLDAKKMGEDIGHGGKSAEDALQLTLDKLRDIKDPVKQAQAAVALFGTQAEDLGAALYALDPSQATDALGDVAGATQQASDAMSDAAPWTEKLNRKWQELQQNLGDRLMPIFNKVGDWLSKFWQKIAPSVREALDYIKQKFDENRDGLEQFVGFLKDMAPYAEAAAKILIGVLAGAIGLLIEATAEWGRTWSRIKEVSVAVTDEILADFGTILHGAADAFGWIPGLGPKLHEAADKFDKFAADVRDKINGIPDQKIVDVRIRVSGLSQAASAIQHVLGISAGIGIKGHATGGIAGGLSSVAERGGEILDLPQGTMVYSNANSNQMIAQANMSAGGPMYLLGSDGSSMGDLLVELIASTVRRRGGKPTFLGLKS